MANLPKDIKQFELNYICSCLLFCRIQNSADLAKKFDVLIKQIDQNPEIFKRYYTKEECIAILKQAIKIYSASLAFNIKLNEQQVLTFDTTLKQARLQAASNSNIPLNDDLSNVTKSYDRLTKAQNIKKIINKNMQTLIKEEETLIVPQIIFGAGDTGTTLWLEKFKDQHGKTLAYLADKKIPPVLMIAEDAGSWHHNYTLAQRHSILERATGIENPSAYVGSHYYEKNPHANGRHVYQANQVNLALTEAPLLQASVLKLEKQSNHQEDWQVSDYPYRLIIQTANGTKKVYAQEINICTGLGPAKNIIADTFLKKEDFLKLNQFDKQREFTPIIDGNDFILTGKEEKKTGKTIVIFGGGGTAAACYRKGFFGNDLHTQERQFMKEYQRNQVYWVATNFNKAGTGTLATTALANAKERKELRCGTLQSIQENTDGRLTLTFKNPQENTDNNLTSQTFTIDCDQFIYSVGQDNSHMRSICMEIENELALLFDHESEMVLNVSSGDKRVLFFGAAAMAIREKEYMSATWSWLKSENIGGDVGPGSMPPSRAQIKRYNFLQGQKIDNINANMDCKNLIVKFLEDINISKMIALNFVQDLLNARQASAPAGASHQQIKELLIKHKLDNIIEIHGHAHLVKKALSPSQARAKHRQSMPILSWLGSERRTANAGVLVSSVSTTSNKKEKVAISTSAEIQESSLDLKV
ncbi:hypothetical protein [Legionella gresilensis]|uniref:hypothetical protein n=1 Tax=Legionella gresilensis TaxID=91823 RepID=UPI0010412210|nr:hypothetical protein [Legionella gresilensis]